MSVQILSSSAISRSTALALAGATAVPPDFHFVYVVLKDLLSLVRPPSALPPCECHCAVEAAAGGAGECGALERLLEKRFSVEGRVEVAAGLNISVSFLVVLSFWWVLVGVFIGYVFALRGRASEPSREHETVRAAVSVEAQPAARAAFSPKGLFKGGRGQIVTA